MQYMHEAERERLRAERAELSLKDEKHSTAEKIKGLREELANLKDEKHSTAEEIKGLREELANLKDEKHSTVLRLREEVAHLGEEKMQYMHEAERERLRAERAELRIITIVTSILFIIAVFGCYRCVCGPGSKLGEKQQSSPEKNNAAVVKLQLVQVVVRHVVARPAVVVMHAVQHALRLA